MEFHIYLTKLLAEKGMTRTEVAKRLQKSESYVSFLCSGRKKPPRPDSMALLIRAVDANKEEAKRLMDYALDRALGDHSKLFKSTKGLELRDVIVPPKREIPILSWVNASVMAEADDADLPPGIGMEGSISVGDDVKGKHLFALKVKDNCMEPEFRHGDIIIVDPDLPTNSGDFVVAKMKDQPEATFKQLKIYDTKIVLHPLNPSYTDLEFTKREFEKIKIIGRVIEKKKRYL